MRKYILLLLFPLLSGCMGCTTISPGYVGVVVNKWGSDRGVANLPLKTGLVMFNPFSETVFEYPVFVRSAVWTHSLNEGKAANEEITFTTADQMIVSADISLAYHLKAEKVPQFYVKFRSDDLDVFTHGFLRNLAREKFDGIAGKYKIEQIMGDNADFLKEVRKELQADIESEGVVIDQFGFIGAPRPPQAVIEAINNKVKQVQDAIAMENRTRQIEAQAKQVVVQAKAQADSNELLTKSLSENLIRWRQLEITQEAVRRWDGKRPMVEGTSGGLLLQLNPQK